MDLVWIVYLIDVVCGLSGFGWKILAFLAAFVGGITWGACQCAVSANKTNNVDGEIAIISFAKPVCITGIILVVIFTLIPKNDTAYKMLAAYGATELIQMEEAQEIGSKAYKALDKILSDYIGEDIEEVTPTK